MDEKRAPGRSKRPVKPPDDGSWDCSVCTFKNSPEAYKCDMCDVRKGTSTRKPKLNPQLVAQQVAQQYAGPLTPPPGSPNPDDEDQDRLFPDPEDDLFGPPPAPPKPVFKKDKGLAVVNKGEKSNTQITKQNTQQRQHKQTKKNTRPPRLKNVDRTSGEQIAVTVDNVTVMITDYQPKKRKLATELTKVQSDMSDTSSNASNDIHEDRLGSDNQT
ncbi:RING1 and YY1-binding protein-like [Ruditapes philippinarum]|uniref:RING1 and YY1-binding protein-like n=1 Tax=Ruditapes philippinarum TaxID=129788 RepID=UPI00295A9FC7|nr:RING1 and YY1-binding protein-like [Ruditapes philippinarum]